MKEDIRQFTIIDAARRIATHYPHGERFEALKLLTTHAPVLEKTLIVTLHQYHQSPKRKAEFSDIWTDTLSEQLYPIFHRDHPQFPKTREAMSHFSFFRSLSNELTDSAYEARKRHLKPAWRALLREFGIFTAFPSRFWGVSALLHSIPPSQITASHAAQAVEENFDPDGFLRTYDTARVYCVGRSLTTHLAFCGALNIALQVQGKFTPTHWVPFIDPQTQHISSYPQMRAFYEHLKA